MGWQIYASLDHGTPTLKIIDPEDHRTVLDWHYQGQDDTRTFDCHEIKSLFQQLILLTCQQQAKNNRCFSYDNVAKINLEP